MNRTRSGQAPGVAVDVDEKRVDAIFAALDQCHRPGAAVGIAVGGRPVYRKGFGLASMELPAVLSPATRMRIASTSKHFTCLAYLLLCEDGKAGLDDPIGKYIPELHPVARQVTLRELMGHVGGLRDALDITYQFSGTGQRVSSADLLSLYRDIDDVNAARGATWNYSNGGYLLLSVAIERITGQSLERVLRERIFEPVGMYDTLLRRFDTDFVPSSATGHMTSAAGGFEKCCIGIEADGGGGIVTTVNDMLRWLAHMDAPVVGTRATWESIKTPQVLANGTSTGYGLGLAIDRYRGVETLHHAGGMLGSSSQMLKVPAAALDVIVMVNRHDVSAALLVNEILDACLPGLNSIQERPSRRAAVGIFRSVTTGRVIALFAKDGQQIASIDGTDMPVEPDGNGTLWPAETYAHMRLGLSLAGDPARPDSIRLSDYGNVDELVWQAPAGRVDVGAIAGRYRSGTTGTGATIFESDEGVELRTAGRFGAAEFRLECLTTGVWRARPKSSTSWWGGVLSFADDGFRFSSLRTRALHFLRIE